MAASSSPSKPGVPSRPTTVAGRLAIVLALVAVALVAFVFPFGVSGHGAPWLAVPGVLALAFALAGSVVALVAIVHSHEASWPVVLALVPGGMAFFLLAGELLGPRH